ncbi:hypothetical protein ACFLZN_01805 [Nanoarchaeota archaeon]
MVNMLKRWSLVLDQKNLAIVSVGAFLAIVLGLSALFEPNLAFVFIGMLPLLLNISVSLSYFERLNQTAFWFYPLASPIAFYAVWLSGLLKLISDMNGPIITVFNILFSYAYNALFLFFFKKNKGEKLRIDELVKALAKADGRNEFLEYKYERDINKLQSQTIVTEQEVEFTPEKDVTTSLRSIEDKCKSLNFAIGRVYGNKKGGCKALRDALRIKRESYNTFSELAKKLDNESRPKLLKILQIIKKQLNLMKLKEFEVFPEQYLNELNLKRDPAGNNTILDVLIANDKDPVKDYFEEAEEFCDKLTQHLATV